MSSNLNQHTMTIEGYDRAATLERLLRVIRHRGFRLCKMVAESSHKNGQVALSVVVESEKSIQLLHNQLSKLVDVFSVEISTAELTTNQLRISA